MSDSRKLISFMKIQEAKSSPETYTRLLREVENCKLHIQDILEDEYDLEYFEPDNRQRIFT